MPTVTLTNRELKNTKTGLDLMIASYTEKPGLLKNTLSFTVVAVSNLRCFKLPQHKDTDVVQFSITKEHEDFESFGKKLAAKFPGTPFPPLPKSLLSFVEGSVKDRVSQLEKVLKFIAANKKLAVSQETIDFLGFNQTSVKKMQEKSKKVMLFEENEQEEDDLFQEREDENEDELFKIASVSSKDEAQGRTSRKATGAKLFADQDYGGELMKNDELAMMAPVFSDQKDEPSSLAQVNEDEDLLKLDDNLDDLCLSSMPDDQKVNVHDVSSRKQPSIEPKPVTATKPVQKPSIPSKPRSLTSFKSQAKPAVGDLAARPNTELSPGDILKYIEENTQQDDDIDLFS